MFAWLMGLKSISPAGLNQVMQAKRAKQMGYRNVHVMSAGISGWLNANLPKESGE